MTDKESYNLKFLHNTKIRVGLIVIFPSINKRHIIQCTRCEAYCHSKINCMKQFRYMKWEYHVIKICTKTKDTLATCELCNGSLSYAVFLTEGFLTAY